MGATMLRLRYTILASHLLLALLLCGFSSMVPFVDVEYVLPGVLSITFASMGAVSALVYVLVVSILDGKRKPTNFDKLVGEVIYIGISMCWVIATGIPAAYQLGDYCNDRSYSYCYNHPWSILEITLSTIHLILLAGWIIVDLVYVNRAYGGLRGYWNTSMTALVRKEVLRGKVGDETALVQA